MKNLVLSDFTVKLASNFAYGDFTWPTEYRSAVNLTLHFPPTSFNFTGRRTIVESAAITFKSIEMQERSGKAFRYSRTMFLSSSLMILFSRIYIIFYVELYLCSVYLLLFIYRIKRSNITHIFRNIFPFVIFALKCIRFLSTSVVKIKILDYRINMIRKISIFFLPWERSWFMSGVFSYIYIRTSLWRNLVVYDVYDTRQTTYGRV